MMGWFRPTDHAFAGRPVFVHPHGLFRALIVTRRWSDARLLCDVWRQFKAKARIDPEVRLSLAARLINLDSPESVEVRSGAVIRGILRNERGGRIDIGPRVYVGDATILSASVGIVIGASTLLAHGVQVFDNDSHPIDAEERARHFRMILGVEEPAPVTIGRAPVRIGTRCWIGMQSLIMKGVTIGDDSIVAAGSVVVGDIPPRVIAGGNPARVIRPLSPGP